MSLIIKSLQNGPPLTGAPLSSRNTLHNGRFGGGGFLMGSFRAVIHEDDFIYVISTPSEVVNGCHIVRVKKSKMRVY